MVAEYDETMGAHLRDERNELRALVAEADQIAAELQALHESDDFRAVAAAVDKYAGTPLQTNVYTVIAAWSTLSDHRDIMVQDTQNELQNVMWTSTQEMLELLKQRIGNSRDQELKIAAIEQDKITKLRLEKLL